MGLGSPNKILEQQLRRAILDSLHELVPEFRSHVAECVHCGGFHDWTVWRHRESTNEWHAVCPATGESLILPLELPGSGGSEGRRAIDSSAP